MARVSDKHNVDPEKGTGTFLLPESGDKDTSADASTGGISEKSGSTDHSCLDPEQPSKPLIAENYMIGIKSHNNKTGDSMNLNNFKSANNSTKTKKKRTSKSIGVVPKLFCCMGGVTLAAGIVLIVLAVFLINSKKCDDTNAKSSAIVGESSSTDKGNSVKMETSSQKTAGEEEGRTGNDIGVATEISFTLPAMPSTTSPPFVFEHLVNLASRGEAFQSSTHRSKEGLMFLPSSAIDGSNARSMNSGSCAQTDAEQAPVWWIDLGALKLVKRVRILQPSDCCGGSLSNFEVRVGQQQDLAMNVLCRDYMGAALNPLVDVICQRQIYGRYVSIQLLNENNRKRRLTICEVSIYDR